MSEEPLVRSERVWVVGLMPILASVFLVIVLGVYFAAERSQRALPYQLAYMPSESFLVAGTSSLSSLWAGARPHTGRFIRGNSDELTGAVQDLLTEFAQRCLPIATAADLQAWGLDPSRSAALSLQWSEVIIAALPVSNREKLATTFERWTGAPRRITLSSADPEAEVVGFRVVSATGEGATLCVAPGEGRLDGSIVRLDGTPVELAANTWVQGQATRDIFFALDAGTAELSITCISIEADNGEGVCHCEFEGKDCSDGRTLTVQAGDSSFEREVLDGSGYPDGAELWDAEGLLVLLPEAGEALIGNNRAMLMRAYENREAQATLFSGDDGLLGAVNAIAPSVPSNGGFLVGLARSPMRPLRVAPFVAVVDPGELSLAVLLSIEELGSRFLRRLSAADVVPPSTEDGFVGPLAAALRDPSLDSYLAMMQGDASARDSADETFLEATFGNFSSAMMLLADYGGKSISARLLGMRDGVPDAVLTIEGLSASEREAFVFALRRQIRIARDIEVLSAAVESYSAFNTGDPPNSPVDLRPFLGDEAASLWERYVILPEGPALRPEREWTPVDFETAAYAYTEPDSRYLIGFIAPEFSWNDQYYRLSAAEREAISIEALRRNRFRLAFMTDATGRVILGTDATVLRRFSSPTTTPPASNPDKLKLISIGDPSALVDEAFLHPDPSVRDLVERQGFAFFEQYGSAELAVREAESFGDLLVTLRFRHE